VAISYNAVATSIKHFPIMEDIIKLVNRYEELYEIAYKPFDRKVYSLKELSDFQKSLPKEVREEFKNINNNIIKIIENTFTKNFLNSHHPNYIREKLLVWNRWHNSNEWEKRKKDFIDCCYYDNMRIAIFYLLDIPFERTDHKKVERNIKIFKKI
jgi:hypothetical protein